jgi:hypothetical protein
MKKHLAWLIAGIVLISGCAPRAKYSLRYNTVQVVDEDLDAAKAARVSAFVLDVPESAGGKAVSDLPERAQAEAIKVLGSKAANTKDFLAAVGGPIGRRPQKSGAENRSVFRKRVVLSIENLATTALADRFTFAELSLTFPGNQAQFLSWDKFATQYQTVDLGSLSYSQNREIDFKINAKPPQFKEVTGAELDTKNANALQEHLALQQRFISITGSLTPGKARLVQQGAPGIDLAGNVAIDLTLSVPADRAAYTITDFGDLFDGSGKPTDPAQLIVADRIITAPLDQCHDIKAEVTLNYVLRHVVSGGETLAESDDDVQLRRGTLPGLEVTLVPADELKVATWTLQLHDRNLDIQRTPGVAGGTTQTVTFDSYDQAKAFLVWLNKTRPHEINGRLLTLAGLKEKSFDPAESGYLLIARTDKDCGLKTAALPK